MTSQEIISLYENVADITDQMLAAARSSDWERLAALESRCSSQVDLLRNAEPLAPLTGAVRERKVRIIRKILEDDRQIRSLTEPWMAAREHHAKLLVTDRVDVERFVHRRCERPFGVEQPSHFWRERERGPLTSKHVERAILGGRHQPGGRVVRHAAHPPDLERPDERVLHDVLGQRQVVHTEDSRERGDHPSRLTSEQMVVELTQGFVVQRHAIAATGRISTEPSPASIGQPLANSTASSKFFASMTV